MAGLGSATLPGSQVSPGTGVSGDQLLSGEKQNSTPGFALKPPRAPGVWAQARCSCHQRLRAGREWGWTLEPQGWAGTEAWKGRIWKGVPAPQAHGHMGLALRVYQTTAPSVIRAGGEGVCPWDLQVITQTSSAPNQPW